MSVHITKDAIHINVVEPNIWHTEGSDIPLVNNS